MNLIRDIYWYLFFFYMEVLEMIIVLSNLIYVKCIIQVD